MTTSLPEREHWKRVIKNASQVKLGEWYRFLPFGHPIFCDPELYECFNEYFKGFTVEISKAVGWDRRFPPNEI